MKSKGVCYEKIPHEKCGSSNGLQVFQHDDGTFDGFCFSCGTYVPDPYGGEEPPKRVLKVKTPEEIAAELSEISSYPSCDVPDRALTKKVLDYFGVKVSVSEYDGQTPVARWYPYHRGEQLTGYKCKTHDKQMFVKGSATDVDMFGWKQAQSADKYRLFITEGEDDAMALFRVLVKKWKGERPPAVVSLPMGSQSVAKALGRHKHDIERMFKEVILVFDNDEPGRIAVTKACKLMPGVKVATLPLKDANDMLVAGRESELYEAVMWQSTAKISGKTYNSSEVWHLAEQEVKQGLPWPWPSMTQVTRGRRRGEVHYFGSGTKMGKSVLVDQMAAFFCKTQDTPVFLVKPEEAIGGTLKRLAGKAVEKVFWDPNIPYSKEDFARGREIIGSKAFIYDGYHGVSWEGVKDEIRQAVIVGGAKDVFLDPLTCFTAGMSLTEQNETLVGIASEFAAMALELDFTGLIFCHLNAPQNGPSHERGGQVLSVQFAGSRAMQRFCHAMWGLQGNKDPDLPETERNMRTLVLLEDRNFGESCKIPLFYNKNTGCLNEISVGDSDE